MITADNEKIKLENLKVLLTEDDPIALKVHKSYLEKMGFEVDVAIDGNEAVEKYTKNFTKYIFAVLDARLPFLDGFSFAKYIREHESKNILKRMPLILISAEPYEDLKQKCFLSGIDNFVQKPICYTVLKDLIAKSLNTKTNS